MSSMQQPVWNTNLSSCMMLTQVEQSYHLLLTSLTFLRSVSGRRPKIRESIWNSSFYSFSLQTILAISIKSGDNHAAANASSKTPRLLISYTKSQLLSNIFILKVNKNVCFSLRYKISIYSVSIIYIFFFKMFLMISDI